MSLYRDGHMMNSRMPLQLPSAMQVPSPDHGEPSASIRHLGIATLVISLLLFGVPIPLLIWRNSLRPLHMRKWLPVALCLV